MIELRTLKSKEAQAFYAASERELCSEAAHLQEPESYL